MSDWVNEPWYKECVKEEFKLADTDGSGFIEASEVKKLLEKQQENIAEHTGKTEI